MIHVENGTDSVGYMMISVHQWFISSMSVVSRTKANILNSGMNNSVSGIRKVRNTPVTSVAEPQNFMRARAKAAVTLITMVMATTHTDTSAELRKNIRYW